MQAAMMAHGLTVQASASPVPPAFAAASGNAGKETPPAYKKSDTRTET